MTSDSRTKVQPDVKLLPKPPYIDEHNLHGGRLAYSIQQMKDYARANMEPLIAEVERLRGEVGELHMHAQRRDQYAVEKAAQALDWKDRAERLAEALREAADDLERGIDARIVVAQLRAALDQETTNG